jgi:hypothetical protein
VFFCSHLLFQQTFTHQIYVICHENLIYMLGVTFADLREAKCSVAVLEQQEAGQNVCRPCINSEGFVSYMFMGGFQFVWLFYTGANILNFMYFTPIMCEFMCFLFIFYYLNSFKWYVLDFPHTVNLYMLCLSLTTSLLSSNLLWLPSYHVNL